VCGRRLLIWQYKQTLDARRQWRVVSSQCRELTLPPSDLAHRADLVSVFIAEGSQVSTSGHAVGKLLTLSRRTTYMYIFICRTVSSLNSRTATKVVGGGFNSSIKDLIPASRG